ncbi:MAG: DUF3596 domain-containing protein [Desulfobacterales bacterium]
MERTETAAAERIRPHKKEKDSKRKSGINSNREGSVRNVNGKVYVDFTYLGERVRESSGLLWNDKNRKDVREQLDRIIVQIRSGEFRFAKIFQDSKKAEYFTEKEAALYGERSTGKKTPEQVNFREYAEKWYGHLRDSERVTPRTLLGYRSYLDNYLCPFFGEYSFADLNIGTLDRFVSWSKKQQYRGKSLSNNTVNKTFVPLKMICRKAAVEYGWGDSCNPFFGFKKLAETDPYEKIAPFSAEEQERIISELPPHWKPYFLFAFCSGLRQGEQIAVRPDDIDWPENILKISRAVTLDEYGRFTEGKTKNRHSRRTISLIPVMKEALLLQKSIHEHAQGNIFSAPPRERIRLSNLRKRVWIPALKRAGIKYREMKQTRHSLSHECPDLR